MLIVSLKPSELMVLSITFCLMKICVIFTLPQSALDCLTRIPVIIVFLRSLRSFLTTDCRPAFVWDLPRLFVNELLILDKVINISLLVTEGMCRTLGISVDGSLSNSYQIFLVLICYP